MPVKWPANVNDLKAAGYEYDNDAHCRGCEKPIEWWITPNGKPIPLDVKPQSTIHRSALDLREPHWASCPDKEKFRK